MSDSYTETSSQGWFSRIGSSIKGMLVGGILVLVAVGVLFWNEGRSVRRAQALAEVKGDVVTVDSGTVDAAREGRPVYVSGPASAAGTLRDPLFEVSAPNALRLRRYVEMYQWKEDRKTETRRSVGGGEEKVTTYEYRKVWDDSLIDSSDFHYTQGHSNPPAFPFSTMMWNAPDATLGAFELSAAVLDELSPEKPITPQVPTGNTAPTSMPSTAPAGPEARAPATPSTRPAPSRAAAEWRRMLDSARVSGDLLYFGNPSGPVVGDTRVSFQSVPPGPISVVAKQVGRTFASYDARSGAVLLVEAGAVPVEQMFKHAEDANRMMTWLIRGMGFIVITIGFSLVLNPLKVLADVVPFIGSIVGFGTFVAALLLAAPVWLLTVAIAWLFYRPVFGVGLIVLAIAFPLAVKFLRKPKAPTLAGAGGNIAGRFPG